MCFLRSAKSDEKWSFLEGVKKCEKVVKIVFLNVSKVYGVEIDVEFDDELDLEIMDSDFMPEGD